MALGRPTKKPRAPFGQRLHDLRQQAGLSQQQVAEKLGMSQRAYSHWERLPVALRPEQLQQLAQALQLSLDELIGGTAAATKKRGPKSQLELRLARVQSLPRKEQDFVIRFLDTVLEKAAAA